MAGVVQISPFTRQLMGVRGGRRWQDEWEALNRDRGISWYEYQAMGTSGDGKRGERGTGSGGRGGERGRDAFGEEGEGEDGARG